MAKWIVSQKSLAAEFINRDILESDFQRKKKACLLDYNYHGYDLKLFLIIHFLVFLSYTLLLHKL